MDHSVAAAGGVDVWTDLLIACLVVLAVLAPAFFFRVSADSRDEATASPPKRASIYYHNENDSRAKRRRQVEVQQRPSGGQDANRLSKGAPAPPIRQKKVL
ncbi:hypothetical protein PHYPSEUDO_006673 [Phytophthora pseudosyringae]|uniref:Uncharacterized protein n=1 Tax=Phytophthora pseudosyringae TaxID=221518 RepID=A0A8T1VLG2_9STRA|nr:hypothetical protein PHYPSEUDO_006673 [Phytophthora pseudosyringae]